MISTQVLALLRWEWTCGFDVEGMDLKTLVAARVEINRSSGAPDFIKSFLSDDAVVLAPDAVKL